MDVSRRRVLAGLTAVGGIGALSGSGTAGLFRDEERVRSGLQTGILDAQITYWVRTGDDPFNDGAPDGIVDGPRVDIPVGPLNDDRPNGSVLLRVSLPEPAEGINNPARLWIRAACPAMTTLAEFLRVSISYADADGTPSDPLVDGTGQPLVQRPLREAADTLRTGLPLDGDGNPEDGNDCLVDDLHLLVEYDLGGYVGAETVSLPLFVTAIQCRNSDEAMNPFTTGAIDDPCEPGFACDCCWAIGKVNVNTRFRTGETYSFDEGLTAYALSVTDTDGDSGVAFELIATDGRTVPPLCESQVKGGPDDEQYPRREDKLGFDTTALDGALDGLVYAPENPNTGRRYAISYVLVKVCAPTGPGGDCPANVVSPAVSTGTQSPGSPRQKRNGNGEKP
jgi:hypothetical protein